MKQIHGLDTLIAGHQRVLTERHLARWLINDLQHCRCDIYGSLNGDDNILLARLDLLEDSLRYDDFDQRIDLIVSGPIVRNDCAPLTYRLHGHDFAISGRCSMIGKVCGVDLYLQASYTGVIGDIARHHFAIAVKPLLKIIKSNPVTEK